MAMKRSPLLHGRFALVLLLVLGACAPAREAPQGVGIQTVAEEDRELVVHIRNDLTPPTALTIWIVPAAGERRVLGTVTMNDAASFPVDAFAEGQYRLVAHTAAGAEISSEPFTPLIPGTARWNVGSNQIATVGLDEKRNPVDDTPFR
jgi:hypothetical protein